MRAKEYLLQIRNIHIRIENKRERIEKLRGILTSPAVGEMSQDKVLSSVPLDKQESMIIEKDKLENELQSLLYKEAELIINIGKQIDGMDKPEHQRLLHLRYEENKTLLEIADAMGYSYTFLRHLHGIALKDFENKYLEKSEINKT